MLLGLDPSCCFWSGLNTTYCIFCVLCFYSVSRAYLCVSLCHRISYIIIKFSHLFYSCFKAAQGRLHGFHKALHPELLLKFKKILSIISTPFYRWKVFSFTIVCCSPYWWCFLFILLYGRGECILKMQFFVLGRFSFVLDCVKALNVDGFYKHDGVCLCFFFMLQVIHCIFLIHFLKIAFKYKKKWHMHFL